MSSTCDVSGLLPVSADPPTAALPLSSHGPALLPSLPAASFALSGELLTPSVFSDVEVRSKPLLFRPGAGNAADADADADDTADAPAASAVRYAMRAVCVFFSRICRSAPMVKRAAPIHLQHRVS